MVKRGDASKKIIQDTKFMYLFAIIFFEHLNNYISTILGIVCKYAAHQPLQPIKTAFYAEKNTIGNFLLQIA